MYHSGQNAGKPTVNWNRAGDVAPTRMSTSDRGSATGVSGYNCRRHTATVALPSPRSEPANLPIITTRPSPLTSPPFPSPSYRICTHLTTHQNHHHHRHRHHTFTFDPANLLQSSRLFHPPSRPSVVFVFTRPNLPEHQETLQKPCNTAAATQSAAHPPAPRRPMLVLPRDSPPRPGHQTPALSRRLSFLPQ